MSNIRQTHSPAGWQIALAILSAFLMAAAGSAAGVYAQEAGRAQAGQQQGHLPAATSEATVNVPQVPRADVIARPANHRQAQSQRMLDAHERAVQILNRFTFGPRPGEVDAVARMGWESWFEQQLDPSAIPDTILDTRLAQYPALQLPPRQLAVQFPDGQVIRRVAEGKLALPQDPQLAEVYEVLLARYQHKQAEEREAAAAPTSAAWQARPVSSSTLPLPPSPPILASPGSGPALPLSSPAGVPQAQGAATGHGGSTAQQAQQQRQSEARGLADQVLGSPRDQQWQALLRLPVKQRLVLTAAIADPEKRVLLDDFNPRQRELFQVMSGGYGGNGVVANELQQAKLVRAVLSERQLQEVMTDFWLNHFNIDLGKSGDEIDYAPSYERDAIRAHALGKFRDLLLATARHPAMLLYLDNWQSVGPDSAVGRRSSQGTNQAGRPGAKAAPQRGLNENYSRELMELHTLGVDGGYTQADVTSLASILTGWTIDQPQLGGDFLYDPRRHEPGVKLWRGQQIGESGSVRLADGGIDGMEEGVRAVGLLAAAPQTAHFLSYELAQRFVADQPPGALVDRMAAAYRSSDGDIRTMLRAMVHSPEFFERAAYRNKVKMPLEYVASSLRATGTDPANAGALTSELRTMGEPLLRCLPPNGYASTADHWMNSAALVDRLNYALQLTSGHFGGMVFNAPGLLAAGLLARSPSPVPRGATHAVALRPREVSATDLGGQEEALQLMEQLLVPGPVSDQTNSVIRQQLWTAKPAAKVEVAPGQQVTGGNAGNGRELKAPVSTPLMSRADVIAPILAAATAAETLDKMAAMILGSPEFQMH